MPTNKPEVVLPESAAQAQERALREGIAEMILGCTSPQLALLHRIHDSAPWKGLENCPARELPATFDLLRRTIMSNTGVA